MEPNSAPHVQGRIGVLVVGAGFIADQHIAALCGHARAELVGVVDVDAGRAEGTARSSGGVRWSTDLAEALGWPEVQACIVCTPNDTHAQIGLAVAAAGKHLLVEKPLATTTVDAHRLVDAFASAGRVLMAAHTHRFYDYARAVKAALDAGHVGRPLFARLALLGGWIWPDWRAWMLDPVRSGGHALHNGVHLLDLMTWWLGEEPEAVYVRGRKQTAAELDIYDYLEMTILYRSGATAVCEMSRAHRLASLNHRDVLVVGTNGMLTLPWDGEAGLLFNERGLEPLPPTSHNGFAVQMAAFLDAISGARPAMTPADSERAVALGVAAERSIVEGRPVLPAAVAP